MAQIAAAARKLISPFASVASWYNRTAQSHPLTVGVITSGLKTSAADVFAQKVIEKREDFDWTRHAAFCAFGFAYLGGFQYWLYNVKFPSWCGTLTRMFGHRATAPIKTFIDQALHHPFIYFPAFFAIKASVSGQPMSSAVDKYRSEIWDSLKALWMVWVPAQFVNFAFVPRHLRIPYVAAVSFGWTVILSVMQGKFDDAIAAQKKMGAATGNAAAMQAAVAAEAVAAATAAPAPKAPSLLPPAAAVVAHQPQSGAAVVGGVSALPRAAIVAAAVAEGPGRATVEEA
ncbi:peroxisomal membrane family [Chlorella sorokiniana]|jgi:protein Mpv17|uniref:Peroxisomal membrane family n=1 Tax=Chlorella sorokiniana TaxID=3076 RepID=A0A2P6TK61_CHLSO|nr:peroxisomal membrane family [Chlorella sorokiniana]|eukprot:PRW44428.1 peroxisomal membrane family [Chlorella sorokiniana]